MISYARGLILKHGDRLMVFKNTLDDQRVQFEYTDNGQYITETIGENYRSIRNGKYALSRSPCVVGGAQDVDGLVTVLPAHIDPHKEKGIAYKLKFIKAAVRGHVPACSLPKLTKLIDQVYTRLQNDSEETNEFKHFRRPSTSTVREWIRTYKRNGSSAFAIVDKRGLTKRKKRICPKADEMMDEIIQKHYLKLRGDSISTTYKFLTRDVRAYNSNSGDDLKIPSLSTLMRRVNELPKFVVDRHRFGISYALNKWRYSLDGDMSTRVMERVEVDHTMLDIWVLDPISGLPLGRPWVTILIDRYSGYILGLHVSFYGPSASTIASALRMSIEPKDLICASVQELPTPWSSYGVAETYVMDNGKEMHSHRFRRIGWELQTDFIYNPVRQPWLKSSIERTMMEVCRILPAQGKVYTPIKNALPPDPKKTATVMFDDLCGGLILWAADLYPKRINKTILTRPIDLWVEGLQYTPPATLPYSTENLDITMGISLDRTVGGDGMTFQYLRYNSPELQDYCRHRNRSFRTEVRIVPDDLSYAFIHLEREKRWIKTNLVGSYNEIGSTISLMQHQIIRKEASRKLKLSNADEELYGAWHRLQDYWSVATAKGKALKNQMALIRNQNLTSARLVKQPVSTAVTDVPEVSEALRLNFEKITPYKSFHLDEEFA
jgi:putative transposase